jgi:hypothetical protein
MIGDKKNYDDVFLRNLTIAVLDTLEGEVYWYYEFSSGTKQVTVPFYYSLTGDEKFVIDTFVDDVVSDNRLTELNTDKIPRGVLTMTGFDILTDQMDNPNVWINTKFEDTDEIKTIQARIRPFPISAKYELVIFLNSENDYFKCAASLMDTIGIYRYMTFEFNEFIINAVIQLPETNQFENTRDKSFTTKNEIKLTCTFDVYTFYPAYRQPQRTGIRAIETQNTWSNAYTYDKFIDNTQNIISPKRTKWYSNIDRSSGNPGTSTSIDSTNPNSL